MGSMLARFSLYGFLKNQRYFEPFLVLAFLEKGVSFFQIGMLIGFRELFRNIMEMPSGAVADLYGRRKAMMISFGAYMVSFVIFGLAGTFWQLLVAMLFFAVGDAFRTGTHKAMIFTWLRIHGRQDEKTRIYGYTRSWAKIGSAVSVVLAAIMVFTVKNYTSVFFFSIVPYTLGFINVMGYPKALEGRPAGEVSLRRVVGLLRVNLRTSVRKRSLRRLMLESMGYEGLFAAAKDYLQPILQATALALPLFVGFADRQRSAVLVGAVYLVLYSGSAFASRHAHRLVVRTDSERSSARALWRINLLLYLALIPLLYFERNAIVIILFVALFMLQNLWRPILISRFDAFATEAQGATVLSIESQAKSLATMLFAPALGYAVDHLMIAREAGTYSHGVFWPVAAVGVVVASVALLTRREPGQQAPER